MVKEVVWIESAKKNFDRLIDYLRKEWSDNVADDFNNRTFLLLELIKEFPGLGKIMKKRNMIRQILISKHNYMVYRIIKNTLVVVNIFDTRQSS